MIIFFLREAVCTATTHTFKLPVSSNGRGKKKRSVFRSENIVSLHISKLDCLLDPINCCLRQPVTTFILWDRSMTDSSQYTPFLLSLLKCQLLNYPRSICSEDNLLLSPPILFTANQLSSTHTTILGH